MFLLVVCFLSLFDLHFCPNGEEVKAGDVSTMTISDEPTKHLTASGSGLSSSVNKLFQKIKNPTKDEIDLALNKANWKLLMLKLANNVNIDVADAELHALIGMRSVLGNLGYNSHFYVFLSSKASYSDRVSMMAYVHGFLPDHYRYNIFRDKAKEAYKLKIFNREERIKLITEILYIRPDLCYRIFLTPHPPFLSFEFLLISTPEESAHMVFEFCLELLEPCDCHKVYQVVVRILTIAIGRQTSIPYSENEYFEQVELIMYYFAIRFVEVNHFEISPQYFAMNKEHLLKHHSLDKELNMLRDVSDLSQSRAIDSTIERIDESVR